MTHVVYLASLLCKSPEQEGVQSWCTKPAGLQQCTPSSPLSISLSLSLFSTALLQQHHVEMPSGKQLPLERCHMRLHAFRRLIWNVQATFCSFIWEWFGIFWPGRAPLSHEVNWRKYGNVEGFGVMLSSKGWGRCDFEIWSGLMGVDWILPPFSFTASFHSHTDRAAVLFWES